MLHGPPDHGPEDGLIVRLALLDEAKKVDPTQPNRVLHGLFTALGAKTPEVRSPVYDGHKLYDVHARLQARGAPVTVPAGNFDTLKIELRVLDNGAEMKDAHFILYLSNTEARLPVLLEAVMPFAVARVELVKAE